MRERCPEDGGRRAGSPGGGNGMGAGVLRSCAVLWRPLLVRAAHRGGGAGAAPGHRGAVSLRGLSSDVRRRGK